MEGFQLWLNLPARTKMQPAAYRDIPRSEIPELSLEDGVRVRVIAGASHGLGGAVERPDTEPLLLDIHLPAGAAFLQPIPPTHNAIVYVYRGEVSIAGETVPDARMAILANDANADGVALTARSDARVLLVAGRPLDEAIAQYGPFVMNTQAELEQAMADYRDGTLAD